MGGRRVLQRRPLGRVVHRGRLAAHRRRGDDRRQRLHPPRRPHQGRRQVGRRVDLLGRARERDHGPPEGQGGGGHRRRRRALGRAAAGLRGARARRRPRRGRGTRLPRGPRGPLVGARADRVHRGGAQDVRGQVLQEDAAGAVRPADGGRLRGVMNDAVAAGLVAALLSGAPSTAITLARRQSVLDGGVAAGSVLVGARAPAPVALAAAVPVHLALSVGWAVVLAAVVPHGRELEGGALGGLAIAALDLVVIGRRFPLIRALPQGRQWADHVAYGLTVGAVLALRRR